MSDSKARWMVVTALVVVAGIVVPAPGHGAELTRVATAFERDNPFDLDLSIGFARTQRRGKITREWHQPDASGAMHVAEVTELRYHQVTQELPMRLAIGLFHDLELHVGASLVLTDDRLWRYPVDQTNDHNSTIHNNCLEANGGVIPGCLPNQASASAVPIFPIPSNAYRAGFGNVTLGLTWAAFNDVKDDSKPKWTLGFDYTAPSAKVDDFGLTTQSDRGPVGDGAHRFNFTTALSKRMGRIDPYVRLSYSLPVASARAYSNCDRPDRLGWAENCGHGPWSRDATGLDPQHVAGLTFGAEFLPYDEPSKQQLVGIDIQVGALYVSDGRVYNEMSHALGKLLYTEEYLSLGGSFGVYARAAEYVQLKLNASLYHDTEHYLTNEQVGQDLNGSCNGSTERRCVDLSNADREVNPTFDFRYDMPGRRFRISEVNVFTVMATAVVNF